MKISVNSPRATRSQGNSSEYFLSQSPLCPFLRSCRQRCDLCIFVMFQVDKKHVVSEENFRKGIEAAGQVS